MKDAQGMNAVKDEVAKFTNRNNLKDTLARCY